ncbi:hypothetical protein SAMN02745116_02616 [Pilibacter termitis]|uniref:Uncharacterized protein n=1 Tax=Pilibacter termitis TaxID=263852 RepID=A0A1T4RI71_9ENTE|nr:hypothetical protein [Pilibacter termitis]SKA15597.1 hypothetical protein SAMN02745116_02616 [Pilibacter termitis]
MFEIKYRILYIEKGVKYAEGINGEYGYFAMFLNGKEFGDWDCREELTLSIFSVGIYAWFSSLLKSVLMLKVKGRVYVDDIEELERYVTISNFSVDCYKIEEVFREKPREDPNLLSDGMSYIVEPLANIEEQVQLSEVVNRQVFIDELLKQSSEYLDEIKNFHMEGNRKILLFSDLIEKVRNENR